MLLLLLQLIRHNYSTYINSHIIATQKSQEDNNDPVLRCTQTDKLSTVSDISLIT